MTKHDSFANDALYNTLGNIVYFFCLWLITVLVVRISGYDDAGILSVAMTTSNVFFVISNYGMRSYQASDVNNEFTDSQYILSRYLTVFVGFASCIIFAIVSHYDMPHLIAIVWFMLFKSVEAFSDVLYGVMQKAHCLKISGVSLCLKGILSVLFFTLILFFSKNLSLALFGMFLSVLVILIFYDIVKTRKITKATFSIQLNNVYQSYKLLKKCFCMFIVSISPMILQAIPKLQFERKYSTEELGIYSSVSSPTIVIPTLVSCIMIPFLPLFAKYIQEKTPKKLLKLFLIFLGGVILLGTVTSLCSYFFGNKVLAILYGNDLHGYSGLLILVIISVTLTSLLYCFNSLFISGRKLTLLAIIYLATLIICYFSTPNLIRRYGINGIALTLIFSQGLQCLLLLLFSIPFFLPYKERRLKNA